MTIQIVRCRCEWCVKSRVLSIFYRLSIDSRLFRAHASVKPRRRRARARFIPKSDIRTVRPSVRIVKCSIKHACKCVRCICLLVTRRTRSPYMAKHFCAGNISSLLNTPNMANLRVLQVDCYRSYSGVNSGFMLCLDLIKNTNFSNISI